MPTFDFRLRRAGSSTCEAIQPVSAAIAAHLIADATLQIATPAAGDTNLANDFWAVLFLRNDVGDLGTLSEVLNNNQTRLTECSVTDLRRSESTRVLLAHGTADIATEVLASAGCLLKHQPLAEEHFLSQIAGQRFKVTFPRLNPFKVREQGSHHLRIEPANDST